MCVDAEPHPLIITEGGARIRINLQPRFGGLGGQGRYHLLLKLVPFPVAGQGDKGDSQVGETIPLLAGGSQKEAET